MGLNLERNSAILIAWKAFTDGEEPEKSDVDALVDLYFQMMREGIDGESIKFSLLEKVTRAGDREMIDFLLARNWRIIDNPLYIFIRDELNFIDILLILSSRFGQLEMVKYLISIGADTHAGNDQAFLMAARNGQLEVVKYLVKYLDKYIARE